MGLALSAFAAPARELPGLPSLPGFAAQLVLPKAIADGETSEIGVKLTLPDGTHAYAPPHEGAFVARWQTPKGIEVTQVLFPVAENLTAAGENFRGYTNEVLLRVKVKAAQGLADGVRFLSMKVSGVVCSDTQCYPVRTETSGLIKVAQVGEGALQWGRWQAEGAAFGTGVVPVAKVGLVGLLAAFVGGGLLNLMPCVFPVLGIKILSFVKSGDGTREKTVATSLAYAAGIVVSLWVLAGVFVALRGAGVAVGWGFQLQSPVVVWALVVVMAAVAANLSGVWEMGGVGIRSKAQEGLWGAFGSGMLMVAVASPCAGPFLGVAFGALVGASPLTVFSVITAVGVGLAGPYVLLASAPSLLSRLPKAGAWMVTLRQALAFPMWGACVYLLWVLSGQVEGWGMCALWGVVAVAGLWLAALARGRRLIALAGWALAAIAVVAGTPTPQGSAAPNSLEAWSPSRQAELVADGRTVLVDFGARWCVTCQTNEAAVASDKTLPEFLARHDVVFLKADWTNPNPDIAAALAGYGRVSVPTWVVLKNGRYVMLPELVSADAVRKAVAEVQK